MKLKKANNKMLAFFYNFFLNCKVGKIGKEREEDGAYLEIKYITGSIDNAFFKI
jgi:hypothetical protein